MKRHLLWKILLIGVLPVIIVIVLVIWVAIDELAADYFMVLMESYRVSPTEIHQMFLQAVHRYLLAASLTALVLALLLSYILTRRILRPLLQMADITREFAAGKFSSRVDATTKDEVGQLGAAFNRMAADLEHLERLRKTLVSDVAHELRTPLTNLRGYLEGLSDGVIPPSAGLFQMLQQEVLRLVNLVEDLEQLARAEAARAHLERQVLSLSELLEQMLAIYRPHFASRQIEVTTSYAAADALRVDRDRVLQAIRNLLENAWKYTPPGGRVRIYSERVDQGLRMVFANSGSGIAEADLPYIFERFFRGDPSRSRETGGSGIGLAIVKELIEAHGGQVGAESSAGETRVWFILPCTDQGLS